ncbi:MAG: helix-turn-helix transcriptional regulator [Oscillospiraceae bacterium]|nr:helix-turn-helix transcriptional regulator [Oscillospiraceae bacterium]
MSNKSMGEFISKLREEKGLTEKELGEKLGITEKNISEWEKNVSVPDASAISKLSEFFGVSSEEFTNSKTSSNPVIKKINYIIDIVLRAIPVAMGAALIVTTTMGQIDLKSGFMMLGISVASIGIYLLKNEK